MNTQKLKSFPEALFDMDGTLVDSMPFWRDLGRDYLVSRGLEPEDDLNRVIGAMTLRESAEYFRTDYGLDESCEQILTGLDGLLEENYRARIPAKPGVPEYLKQLAANGVRMAVFSTTPSRLVAMALERLELLKFFTAIIDGGEFSEGKRAPKAYIRAVEKAGMSAENTVVYEDADFAVSSAKAAGLKVAAVYDASCRTAPQAMRAEADWYIESYFDLL